MTAPSHLSSILAARGAKYGDFVHQAAIADGLKQIMRAAPGWNRLTPYMRCALEMMADKTARTLNGDPRHIDNWDDTAGYAILVANRLRKEEETCAQ